MGSERLTVDQQFERLNDRLDKLEKGLREAESEIENLRNRMDKVHARLASEGQFGKLLGKYRR